MIDYESGSRLARVTRESGDGERVTRASLFRIDGDGETQRSGFVVAFEQKDGHAEAFRGTSAGELLRDLMEDHMGSDGRVDVAEHIYLLLTVFAEAGFVFGIDEVESMRLKIKSDRAARLAATT